MPKNSLEFLKKIAERIRFFRKKSKITQKELAEKCSLNYRHLQKIESGKVDLKLSTIFKFSQTLHVTPKELCGLSSPFDDKQYTCSECSIMQNIGAKILLFNNQGELIYANQKARNAITDLSQAAEIINKDLDFVNSVKQENGLLKKNIQINSKTYRCVVNKISDVKSGSVFYSILLFAD